MTKQTFTPTPLYLVDGTGPYPIQHPFLKEADILVELRGAATTVPLMPGDFSAMLNGDEKTGTLTLSAAVAATYAGWVLSIRRETELEQGWEAETNREQGMEAQLDKLTMAAQDLAQIIARAPFRLPPGETGLALPVRAERANTVQGFNSDGNPVLFATSVADTVMMIGRRYPTRADWLADVGQAVGDIVTILGHTRPGDHPVQLLEIVAADTGTADGGRFIDHPLDQVQGRLIHGGTVHAGWWGVVLGADGNMQVCADAFNAAFAYAAAVNADIYPDDDGEDVQTVLTQGINFVSDQSFLADKTLNMMRGTSAARGMRIELTGRVAPAAGGAFDAHTQERPIPLFHTRLRNCAVSWPQITCEMLCAGVKLKVDIGNQHRNLDLRGFSRYGWWPVETNDSTLHNPIIKQFERNPLWVRNGVDPTDWDEWDGDSIVITTKDRQFIGGQIGWGGPCVRITDAMPSDPAKRIPGRNCYWCGLSADQGYVDGDNGGGDVVFDGMHMMQVISDDAFLDAGAGPRYGVYADYDEASGTIVRRRVDSPIGILSFCAVSNLSKFHQIDNDGVVHIFRGAQIELEGEMVGSKPDVACRSTERTIVKDSRVRVYASLGANGGQRYPFMSSMRHMRQASVTFERDIWTHQTMFAAGNLVDGNSFKATYAAALEDVAAGQPNMRLTSSDGLPYVGVHFTGEGLVTLGQRHAANLVPLLKRAPSTAPIVLYTSGQSNTLGWGGADDGDHTILPGIKIWNSTLLYGPGTGFVDAAFGAPPLDRLAAPWANNLAIHCANALRVAFPDREVYIIMLSEGGRNIESFLPPAVNAANGWTATEDLSWIYGELKAALALVPGRRAIAPDAWIWQSGEANWADALSVVRDKLKALIAAHVDEGVFNPAIEWLGDWREWNRQMRASGDYDGPIQYRGQRRTAGAWSPSVHVAGDYWDILAGTAGAPVTINPGGVTAVDGQILYALTDAPASAGDWLVVDADSAPVRETARFGVDIRPTQHIAYPEKVVAGHAQRNLTTPEATFAERWHLAGGWVEERGGWGSPEGVIAARVGSIYRRLDGGTGTTLYIKETGSGNTGWISVAATGGLDPALTSIAALTTLANQMIYLTGPKAFATLSAPAFGRSLISSANVAAARATLKRPDFLSRADLKTWWLANGAGTPDGTLLTDGSVDYIADAASTAISDMPGLKPYGGAFVDHWPETQAGLQEAAAYCDGKRLRFLARSYSYSFATLTCITADNVVFAGEGWTQTKITITGSAGTYSDFHRGANCIFRDMELTFQRSANGTMVGWLRAADGLLLERCKINGQVVHNTGSNYTKQFHVVKFADLTDTRDTTIRDCLVDGVQFIYLKDNDATAATRDVALLSSTIQNAYSSVAALNSPQGILENYTVDDCDFLSHLGESVDDWGFYGGAATGRAVRFTNNRFYGEIQQCLHFEENIEGLIVEQNQMLVTLPDSTNSGFIVLLTNNNLDEVTIDGPRGLSIKGNQMRNLAGARYGRGIWAYDNLSPFKRYAISDGEISGNIIENVLIGTDLRITAASAVDVNRNIAIDCGRGFAAINMAGATYDRNKSVRCTYGVSANGGGVFSHHTFVDCGALTASDINQTWVSLSDFTVAFPTQDLVAASDLDLVVLDGVAAGARIDGTLATRIATPDNLTTFRDRLESCTWNGSALGGAVIQNAGANATTALSVASEQLIQTVAVASDAANASVTVEFKGVAHLRPALAA